MKIAVLDKETLGSDISLFPITGLGECVLYDNIADEEIGKALQEADVCVTNKKVLGEHNLKDAKNLKLICLCATGYNNVDVEYCKRRGIKVRNVPGYCKESVCQHTFALLLALMESISYYDNFVKDKSYTKTGLANHIGRPFGEIAGKKWGIIGLGGIGREVAKVAESFGAEVSYAPISGKSRKEDYPEVSLETLLKESDIISIHSPLNEKTNNLINKDTIALMKNTALVINVGRGAIVNSEDIVLAVDEGRLGGAGIDVYPTEPPSLNDPFMNIKHPERFVLTPHIAWASVEARERCIQIVGENIKALIENKGSNDVW